MSQHDAAENEVTELVATGKSLVNMLRESDDSFYFDYQTWYTRAARVVEVTLPDRVEEFRGYYEIDPKRKTLGYENYGIQDFCKQLVPIGPNFENFDRTKNATICLINQIAILQSVRTRLDSIIGNIHQTILADVRDRELETAQELQTVSLRAAGALAGVVLERHLQETCTAHKLTIQKRKPKLSDYSESLKQSTVIDVPAWRKLGYLADIRNICCHAKGDAPTAEQVRELIGGVNWAIKTVF